MQYSWSANLNLTKTTESNDSVWAMDQCEVYPVMNDQLYVHALSSGRGVLMAASAFHMMARCNKFERSSVHINNLMTSNPQLKGMHKEINGVIDSLRKAGILVEAETILKKINNKIEDDSVPPPVEEVFIATCDRPAAVMRLLDTVVTEMSQEEVHWKYTVLDDSRDARCSHRVQEAIVSLRDKAALNVGYVGAEKIDGIQRQLAAKSTSLAGTVDYLLWGDRSVGVGTYGAVWNRALILSAGRRLIKVDDDALLKLCVSGEESKDVHLGKVYRKIQFLNGSDWTSYLESGPRRVLNEHAKFLGKPLSEALNIIVGGNVGVSALEHQFVDLFNTINANSKILMTGCGTLGDPGTDSNHWLFGLTDEERATFVHSEAEYVTHKRERNLMSGQKCYAFNTHFDHMSAVTGIDNSILLPPYFPQLRNEDFLFGKMIKFLYPECVVMDQPWMVPHLPIESRQWAHDEATKPRKMGMLFFIGMYLEKQQKCWSGTSVSGRYRALIEVLKDLLQIDDVSLLGIVHQEMSALAASAIYNANESLKEFQDAPAYWKADVQGSIESNMRLLSNLGGEFLGDLEFAGSQKKAIDIFRSLLSRYISALEYWPEIRELAVDMER